MVEYTAPLPLLHKLGSYGSHSNLRVRAKAAISISNCVPKMDLKSMQEFGMDTLIKMASNLLKDKLPEAREAARGIVISLHTDFTEGEAEEKKLEMWQSFCQTNLAAIHAQSMVKLVSS